MIPSGADDPRFAADRATATYYDRRADEYDEWYEGVGLFASRSRPGWRADLDGLVAALESLPAADTIDIACGTGYLTRHLRGSITGVDLSPSMIARAKAAAPAGRFLLGSALALPVGDHSFQRAFTGHFYGHLGDAERATFLAEVRRVANELVIVDAARYPGAPADGWQRRVLNDGSGHRVFKRYFDADGLATECGGSVVYSGTYFVATRAALI